MGLTIYYKLSVEKNMSSAVARELVQRAAFYAKRIGCEEVGEVMRVEPDMPFTGLFVRAGREEDCCFGNVPARCGWMAEVWPGAGCESATFALCKYPRRAAYQLRGKRGFVATDYRGGWLFKGCCKTQYANEHGWAHFLKCHRQIISLLEFWRDLGVTVEVSDEGGYWETRSEEKLRIVLRQYDGLVAAVGGLMKDQSSESGKGLRVESPIFDYANFERLEHEGRLEFGRQVEQLRKETGQRLFLGD